MKELELKTAIPVLPVEDVNKAPAKRVSIKR